MGGLHSLAEIEDGVDVAGDLEVEGAADDADDVALLDSAEAVVGLRVAESGAVFAAHDNKVGVLFHQGFEAIAPSVDTFSDITSAGHADDVVDESVTAGGEVATFTEADDVVDRRCCCLIS